MTRRLPQVEADVRILIICEGAEESDYLNHLKSLNLWGHDFRVDIKNAHSIDNIASVYQYNYSANNYKLIVIFCDTEKYPYEQFLLMKKKIKDFHNKKSIDDIIFFANPCTMQIILSHFDKVLLKSNIKSDNVNIIEKLTGVKDYEATKRQRESITNKITAENYNTMKQNIRDLNHSYDVLSSTNAIVLFDALDSNDLKWVKLVTKKFE